MILPAFGITSHIIETFSRKQLFGHASMVWAMTSIAILSFVVWAHHMFTVGMPLAAELFFMWATMLIAVPTGVKVFNWVTTMFKGSITYETPMLFSIAFVVLFTIGGFSGPDACDYTCRLSIPRYLFCCSAFSLCISARCNFFNYGSCLFLDTKMDREYVR